MRKVKRYKKGVNGALTRKRDEATILRGWTAVEEREVSGYDGKKGCCLFFIFAPLALLGGSKYIEVTYEKKDKKDK